MRVEYNHKPGEIGKGSLVTQYLVLRRPKWEGGGQVVIIALFNEIAGAVGQKTGTINSGARKCSHCFWAPKDAGSESWTLHFPAIFPFSGAINQTRVGIKRRRNIFGGKCA